MCERLLGSGAGVVAAAAATVFLTLAAGAAASPPRDRRPPTTPTIDGERAPTDLRPIFHFGATDDRSTRAQIRFRCAVDGATLAPCAHIYQPFAALAFGPHVLTVRAVDRAGNASRLATFAFNVVGVWDAAADFAHAPRPENPGRDRYGNTSWFYLFSVGSIRHDPIGSYHLLPFFLQLNPAWEVWRSTEQPWFSGAAVGWNNGQIWMHPGGIEHENAILDWRSPTPAHYRILADISQSQTPCEVPQDGINWSIDRGSETLQGGHLAPGESAHPELTTELASGESIYLVINAGTTTNCDGTMVSFSTQTS